MLGAPRTGPSGSRPLGPDGIFRRLSAAAFADGTLVAVVEVANLDVAAQLVLQLVGQIEPAPVPLSARPRAGPREVLRPVGGRVVLVVPRAESLGESRRDAEHLGAYRAEPVR